jgi:membrane associated rhomboid family serine protease
MSWFYRLERKIGKYAIRNLIIYITVGQLAVFLANFFFPYYDIIGYISLSAREVLAGQVWRLVTFVFVPDESSILWLLISLYFYYIIGSNLERIWDSFKFNAYYLLGVLGAIAAAFITGYGSNIFINCAMFLAFAIMEPDYEVLILFILRVKIKWLALIMAAGYVYMLVVSNWAGRAAIIASLINVVLFFWRHLVDIIKRNIRYQKTRSNYRAQMSAWRNGQRRADRRLGEWKRDSGDSGYNGEE